MSRHRSIPRARWVLTTALLVACAPAADDPTPRDSIEADHVVPATPENVVWGWFPIDKDPVVTVESGEMVEIHTFTPAGSNQDDHPYLALGRRGIDSSEVLDEVIAFWETRASRPREGRNGHIITGPVYVNGAEPGDMLEIQILDIRPRVPWGINYTGPRSGVMSTRYPGYREGDPELDILDAAPDRPSERSHVIRTRVIDGREYGVYEAGIRVPLAPFMGIYAVAPDPVPGEVGVDVPGVQRSVPPGNFGGNLDVKHLTAGTSVFLPVFHSGARFYIGDPHGAQGDGEVSGTAIEQSLTGTFRLIVHKNVDIDMPRAETDTHYLIMGIDVDLDRAMRNAASHVVDFLVDSLDVRPAVAYSLTSVAVDFTVSEVVDETQVVTAFVPKEIISQANGR